MKTANDMGYILTDFKLISNGKKKKNRKIK